MNESKAAAKAPGVRAQVRAQLTAEIKAAARRQLALEGASSLSLRAIAREMEMASSAIYRYFASRDELLTALIVDAYEAIATMVEAADQGCERSDYPGRFVAMALSVRSWAVANPHEYALIYGSPVPGYAAPQDTIDPASRVPIALVAVLVERFASDDPVSQGQALDDGVLTASLAGLMEFSGHLIPAEILARGVQAWGQLFGMVSLELFGHFENAVTEPGDFFDHAMRSLAERTLA